ncbi:rhomboid-like protein 11, chloroplastic isoform X2 [Ananas comosus]|uniref:Rhomboid-like protein 11, chloroplastic isoform X2 n=1 Tax=Ananas comosus TaxID=4615 RepID=A0A6P5FKI4_ANACO|nr:rhomboid-like protein 11, chloroplastic isoform X2 [Ananas comosus]
MGYLLLSLTPATRLALPGAGAGPLLRAATAADTWRPPVPPAIAAPRRRIPAARRNIPLLVVRRGRFRCGVGGSDLTSDLELAKPEDRRAQTKRANGIFWILLLNLGIYVADHLFQVHQVKMLYLYHSWPLWYQFITATFCHANWNHLSSNLFFLYIFGKLVEEEEGNLALWISYILTGAGANLVSWLILPRSAVSVGASGAVFGLFAISILVKVMEAAQASAGLAGPLATGSSFQTVNHIAHLSGALIGAALVLLISRIPSHPPGSDSKASKAKDKRT